MAVKKRKELDRILTYALALGSSIWIALILVVMPLYFQEGYTHIGSDKSYLLRTCGVRLGRILLPLSAVWAVCRIRDGIGRRHVVGQRDAVGEKRISAMDILAVLFAVGTVISYACSAYRETALWGTKGWYMGMGTQLILVGSYFLLSRFAFEKLGPWLLFPAFPVSAITFVLGFLNRFDIWPLQMENSGLPIYISTVGNINWFCSYMLAILFAAVGLFWLGQGEKRSGMILWSIYLFTGFASLVTQGSDSGIVAMGGTLLFVFCRSLYGRDFDRLHRFWLVVLLLGGACVFTWMVQVVFSAEMNFELGLGDLLCGPLSLLVLGAGLGGLLYNRFLQEKSADRKKAPEFFEKLAILLAGAVGVVFLVAVCLITANTMHPGSIGFLSKFGIFRFDHDWGHHRGATWPLGLQCFAGQDLLHKLVGVGPDCMAEYLYSEQGIARGLAGVADQVFEGMRLTNAHCELLTMLVNEGLLGAVTYGGMLALFWKRNLFCRVQDLNPKAAACALGVLALSVNNVWSFQQSIGTATMFVLLGLGRYYEK